MISPAYVALWIFVFSIPWENFVIIPGVGAISRLMGMLALGIAILAAVMAGRVRRWHPFHFAALLFVIWAGTMLLVLAVGVRLPNKFYTFVQLFAVIWMIWELAPSHRGVLGLMFAYVTGAYVAALDSIRVYATVGALYRRIVAGTFDPNDLAMTLVLGLPMAWYLSLALQRPLLRWVARAYVPIGLFAVVLTGSRGGMVASIIALTVVPLTMSRLTPGRLMAAVTVLMLSGSLAVIYVPDQVKARLATTRSEVEDVRFGGRFKLWKAGMNAFMDRPITGHGVASFKQTITPQLGMAAQVAHNSYISVLVEEGLVGFILYTAMFIAAFLAVRTLPFVERRFGMVLMAALCVTMLPLTWEDRKSVWVVLALLVGLAQALRGRRQAAAAASAAWASAGGPRPVARPGMSAGTRAKNLPPDRPR